MDVKKVSEIKEMIKKGLLENEIRRKVSGFSKELFSIAKAKIRNEKIKKLPEEFFFTENDLRFATQKEIADYRAQRLKCDCIIEIGSGIGMQSIAFSKTCKKVIAIEIDENKIKLAKENAKVARVDNIEFICFDALKVLSNYKADILFWDPERPAQEEERSLSSIKPDFFKTIEKAKQITENVCVELPPYMQEEVKEDVEKEYVSFGGRLNRLNVYFGSLKKNDVSAIEIPSKEQIVLKQEKAKQTTELKKYLYEIDKTLIFSGLKESFAYEKNLEMFSFGKEYFVSDEKIKSSFVKSFKVLQKLSLEEINKFLKEKGYGEVLLKGSVDPKNYWTIKNKLEENLQGENKAVVFVNGKEGIVCG
jgi:predicted RNA methylase